MNFQFNYLYRDGANYKNYDSVVFSNQYDISLEEITECIVEALIDGVWFYAKKWGLKELHSFPYDSELDHEWHEFESVEQMDEDVTRCDIKDFLEFIKR